MWDQGWHQVFLYWSQEFLKGTCYIGLGRLVAAFIFTSNGHCLALLILGMGMGIHGGWHKVLGNEKWLWERKRLDSRDRDDDASFVCAI
jgi:hypothetical protein